MNPPRRTEPRGQPGVALLALVLIAGARHYAAAQKPDAGRRERGLSGNPVIEGWYADPEAIVYGREYWIYPTYSDDYPTARALDETRLTARQKRANNKQYLKQTYFDAFSSDDLVHWRKHPRVLDVRDMKWAEFALWAPSAIQANGKCYLFFAANDIQSEQE
jgi:hypothetical protein